MAALTSLGLVRSTTTTEKWRGVDWPRPAWKAENIFPFWPAGAGLGCPGPGWASPCHMSVLGRPGLARAGFSLAFFGGCQTLENNLGKGHFIMCHVTKYSTIRGVFQQPWQLVLGSITGKLYWRAYNWFFTSFYFPMQFIDNWNTTCLKFKSQ